MALVSAICLASLCKWSPSLPLNSRWQFTSHVISLSGTQDNKVKIPHKKAVRNDKLKLGINQPMIWKWR
jgi:hypothetical protein